MRLDRDKEASGSMDAMFNPGRMLQDGIPYADFEEMLVGRDELNWFDFWSEKGDQYKAIGERALDVGHQLSGGDWLWLASLCHHYAQYMWFHESEKRERGQERKVELYKLAAPHLSPAAQRTEIPLDDTSIPGYLRLPCGSSALRPFPCVVLIGGLESTKEESYLFERLCLRRGLATFTFDGPGQGEMWFNVKLQPDFERYTSAVVDYLVTRPEIDPERLGVLGRSLGGHYAIKSAASDGRVRACVSWGGFFDIADFDERMPLAKVGYAYVSGASSTEDAREYAQGALDCSSVIGNLRCPLYVLQGGSDSRRQAELIDANVRHAPKDIVIEDNGDHCCHNLGPIVRVRMADWLMERLS